MMKKANHVQFSGFEDVADGFSRNLYLPRRPVDEWSLDECRRALCAKANGDVLACEKCETKCRYGRRIVELLKPAEVEKEKAFMDNIKKAIAARERNSKIKFLSAIASGNPRKWFEENGMSARNAMTRVKQEYGGVTQEEARKRLAEMGVEVKQEAKPEAKPEPIQPQQETAKPATGLKVMTLQGEFFQYGKIEDGMYLRFREGGVMVKDVDALCAEIRAAFAMMGGAAS